MILTVEVSNPLVPVCLDCLLREALELVAPTSQVLDDFVRTGRLHATHNQADGNDALTVVQHAGEPQHDRLDPDLPDQPEEPGRVRVEEFCTSCVAIKSLEDHPAVVQRCYPLPEDFERLPDAIRHRPNALLQGNPPHLSLRSFPLRHALTAPRACTCSRTARPDLGRRTRRRRCRYPGRPTPGRWSGTSPCLRQRSEAGRRTCSRRPARS